ncbi:MAG: pyridoxal-phosphate dependent enzyme, partial [Gemmatimonadetes bacterium]|nr:pyridoxal-phosphate dependent enzyme [Gemmatimonadota bacterium]
MTQFLDLERFQAARERISGRIHRTPLLSSRALGQRIGAPVLLKCENLQKTGSFKVRGALNSVACLDQGRRAGGVVTISAGNHAQAVAWAASAYGVRSAVVMPAAASPLKAQATRDYGGEVILHGTAAEAFREAFRIAEEREMTFLHPFDAEPVIAGHGSTGLELAEGLT